MQVAALLADLKSLSACDHTAALALVNVHKSQQDRDSTDETGASQPKPSMVARSIEDSDLQKAQDLVSLHYDVKVRYLEDGMDPQLLKSRKEVEAVLKSLKT